MSDLDLTTTGAYCPVQQVSQHVHEVLGSTLISGDCSVHSHRFAAVSDEAVPCRGSHVHNITFQTDSYKGHSHTFNAVSGPAVAVGDGRHVHLITGTTCTADGHSHKFRTATMINDPTECR